MKFDCHTILKLFESLGKYNTHGYHKIELIDHTVYTIICTPQLGQKSFG
jgi:hypothetical protein